MDDEPKGVRVTGLVLAHVVCCGGLVLVATGALSGVGTWLFGGGLIWLGAAAVLTAAGLMLWRRPAGGAEAGSPREPNPRIERRTEKS